MVPDAEPSAETQEMSFLDPDKRGVCDTGAVRRPRDFSSLVIHKLNESVTPAPPEIIVVIPLPSGFMTPICVLNSLCIGADKLG